jgi:alpha-L-fucosidase
MPAMANPAGYSAMKSWSINCFAMEKVRVLFLIAVCAGTFSAECQQEESYYPESDPLVLQKLEQWQDLKFGLLMHWGAYSQWGIVESWSICSEDEDWCRRKNPDYEAYKKEYEALKNTFNPIRFDPSEWAKAAKDAGMKYVVFTTKHHDGFCMFDTKTTDYKITDTGCPFSINPNADVTKAIFNAFRAQGLWTGAYFSKPDWHCDYYWWRNFATPDRNVNYRIDRYPQRWEQFVQYTQTQIDELMSNYGRVDILWLDGGWVEKNNRGQDIRMDEIVKHAREKQPGLIVVDRAVPGPFQNYLTPENQVPEQYLPYPWESCIISGGGWAWVPDAGYMTPRKAVQLLAGIVAKGGNLLLNIGPAPDGTWDQGAFDLLAGIGTWMRRNGEAIYATRPVKPYQVNKVAFTMGKDGTEYAIYLPDENESRIPEKIMLYETFLNPGQKVTLLGNNIPLKFKAFDDGTIVWIPDDLAMHPYCDLAWTLKISK